MAAQGERGQEGLEIDLELNESMAQDEITVQDSVMQVDYSPQINAESEIGAVAGAADERPPRANSPTDWMMDMFEALMGKMDVNMQEMNANMQAMRGDLQATNGKMEAMENKMEANECKMNGNLDAMRGGMDENMQTLRGEMQSMGLNLQAGQKAIVAIARSEMRTTEHKMATPRGSTIEPTRGSATAVRPAIDG